MAEFKRPATEADLAKNFEQLHPIMDATMALNASARCLFCHDAPCVTACPSDIDIPMFIRQINSGNVKGAAKTIYSANYFGQICGKVCPTEVLCEGACVYTQEDIAPVEIGSLQTYACNIAIQNNLSLVDSPKLNNKKIAVIGAGPAGIACACELRKHGYEVDVYEAKAKPSGLALHGTAPYKIQNHEVIEEVEYLRRQYGFNLILNCLINDPSSLESEYRAIFLGIGLGPTRSIGIPGENLENSITASEFIEQVKLNPLSVRTGNDVVVIGGGNTAMDAASESARLGAGRVTLAYRRDKQSMSAYMFEFNLAREVGVRSIFNVNPVRILGSAKVTGVELVQTELKGGRIEPIKQSNFVVDCDTVIRATGQEKLVHFLSKIDGLQLDNKGRIQVNSIGQSGNPMYFAAGDSANGGAEVVNAVAEGKKVGQGIISWLT